MLILHSGDKCTSVTGKSDFVQSSQLYRKIQLFDDHGMPLHPAQEIQAIEHCYNDLDASLPDPDHTPLSPLPFDCQEVIDELRALPRMKALFCGNSTQGSMRQASPYYYARAQTQTLLTNTKFRPHTQGEEGVN